MTFEKLASPGYKPADGAWFQIHRYDFYLSIFRSNIKGVEFDATASTRSLRNPIWEIWISDVNRIESSQLDMSNYHLNYNDVFFSTDLIDWFHMSYFDLAKVNKTQICWRHFEMHFLQWKTSRVQVIA